MLFNSFDFLIFLPIVFVFYWFIFNKNLTIQNGLVLIASYIFYGWWSWPFMGLLMLSTLLDYSYGFGVDSSNRKKARFFLWMSIINNIGILGIFKYYNFFALQFQQGFQLIGYQINPTILEIALPIGISFYTFHGMSYIFDIYRKVQKPINSIVDYGVFVSFFPLLVAGPIERANHLLPQIQKKRYFNKTQAIEGCRLILWGLFKKVVIADNLAVISDDIFNNYSDKNAITLIVGAITFSFQIYGDFSGYSDIALGTAKLFGFELLSNFKFPYFSRSVAEFWKRWHISLSSWFRDYLYIPLGGSKIGKFNAIRNTFIIFLVSGFWHGASWKYIVWGFIHACGFLPFLLLNKNKQFATGVVAENRKLPNLQELGQMLFTFSFVTVAWVFFRAKNIHHALDYLKRIGLGVIRQPKELFSFPDLRVAFLYIIPLIIVDWWLRHNERSLRVPPKPFNHLIYILLFLLIFINGFGKDKTFIYFVF
jgi:D-alanyl-lipoteichoic acid acyltransferase DltB (MBOAT superfamily)